MQVSYSRIDLYNKCPYAFKLKYIDNYTVLPDYEPDNPLILGSALHLGLAQGRIVMTKYYCDSFPVFDDRHITELFKLDLLVSQSRDILPKGMSEYLVEDDDFKGFIDLLVPVGDNLYDIYDYKYCRNTDRYFDSNQLHVYKYFFERLNPTAEINKIYYVFFPKITIKQKKDEPIQLYRNRIGEMLKPLKPQIVEIPYDPNKVIDFLLSTKKCLEDEEFLKKPSFLCRWCEFFPFCQKDQKWELEKI